MSLNPKTLNPKPQTPKPQSGPKGKTTEGVCQGTGIGLSLECIKPDSLLLLLAVEHRLW